jgi:3-hydroxy acid dehydrogenase / malonic semialdehyde reductase
MTGWIIVTGASSGIGRATAARFLLEGHPVLGMARRGERLAELGRSLPAGQRKLYRAVTADVTRGAEVQAAVDGVLAGGDGIAGLVNSAGLSLGFGPLHSGDPGDWQVMVSANITGMLNCTHAVLPALRAAGQGHIINIGSLAARYPYHGGNVYAATKAFVHHLSANLLADLAGSAIRVTCIAPGMVRTEFAQVRFGGDAEKADAFYQGIETLTADDVADAVVWAYHTPPRVNVNYLEIMPTSQPFGLAVGRAHSQKEQT